MKKYFLSLLFIIFFSPPIFSSASGNNNIEISVDSIEEDLIDQERLQKEISSLMLEMEQLREIIAKKDEDYESLKRQLEVYKKQEISNNNRYIRISRLRSALTRDIFSAVTIDNDNFKKAYSDILIENLYSAELKLISFLNQKIENHADYYLKQPNNKETILYSSRKDKDSFFNKNTTDQNPFGLGDDLKEAVRTINSDFILQYQLATINAKYLLGQLYLIKLDTEKALSYFIEAYNDSNNPDIIVLSLIGITEVFEIVNKSKESCISLDRIDRTIAKIQEIDSSYSLIPIDEKVIDRIRERFNCDTLSVNYLQNE